MLWQKGWKLNNSADEPISLSHSPLANRPLEHRPWDLPADLDCLEATAISLIVNPRRDCRFELLLSCL